MSDSYQEQLRKVLTRLAAPAEIQANFLKELGAWPSADELALEFDDLVQVLPDKVKSGEISPELQTALLNLNLFLERMSGPEKADLWDARHLGILGEWERVRDLAKHSLGLLS